MESKSPQNFKLKRDIVLIAPITLQLRCKSNHMLPHKNFFLIGSWFFFLHYNTYTHQQIRCAHIHQQGTTKFTWTCGWDNTLCKTHTNTTVRLEFSIAESRRNRDKSFGWMFECMRLESYSCVSIYSVSQRSWLVFARHLSTRLCREKCQCCKIKTKSQSSFENSAV